jgi:hypothetical protein
LFTLGLGTNVDQPTSAAMNRSSAPLYILLFLLLLPFSFTATARAAGKMVYEQAAGRDTVAPEKQYKNHSVLLTGIRSNLGEAMGIDPPVFFGGSVGFEILWGRKVYFGTGLHFNLLGGPIPDTWGLPGESSNQWLYFLKAPVFGGYRLVFGKISTRIEGGLSYAFEPQSVTPGWNMEGLIPEKGSLSAIARVNAGTEILELAFGFETGITEMFTNREGFLHQIIYLGARINF